MSSHSSPASITPLPQVMVVAQMRQSAPAQLLALYAAASPTSASVTMVHWPEAMEPEVAHGAPVGGQDAHMHTCTYGATHVYTCTHAHLVAEEGK